MSASPPKWVERFNDRLNADRKEKLLAALTNRHTDRIHEALLEYINDPEITEAFNAAYGRSDG